MISAKQTSVSNPLKDQTFKQIEAFSVHIAVWKLKAENELSE